MFKILANLHEAGIVNIADALPWRLPIDDGVVMTSAGGFTSSYEYVGQNPNMISDQEYLDIVNDANNALVRSGGGWTFHFDYSKRKGGLAPTPNPLAPPCAQLYDLERRALIERGGVHFVTKQHVSVTYQAPKDFADKAESWIFRTNETERAGASANASAVLDEFLAGRKLFEDTFGARTKLRMLGLRASIDHDGTPIVYDDQLSYLYFTMRGTWQPMLAAPAGITVAKLFAAHEVVMDWKPRIDGDAVGIIMVTRPPEASMLGYLRQLDDLKIEFRASLRLTALGKKASLKYVEQKENEWVGAATGMMSSALAKIGGGKAKVDQMAVVNQASAAELKLRIQRGELVVVFPTFTVTLFDESRAQVAKNAEDVKRVLRDSGFACEDARVNSGRWYAQGLPGEVWAVQGRDAWTSANAAQTISMTSTWTGVEEIPSEFYERGSRPHIIATTTGGAIGKYPLHWNTAGHTLVVGAQRSGKTVFLKRLLLEHLNEPRAGAFVLDRDGGMSTLADELQDEGWADYMDLEDESVQLCPLEFIGQPGREGERERQYGLGFIEHLMKNANIERTTDTRKAIEDGLTRMAQGPQRRLSEAKNFINDRGVWSAIDRFTNPASIVGRILNGAPTGRALRPVQIVETAILSNLDDAADREPIYRQLLHLMDRMSRMRLHMLAFFDECSVYLYDEFLATYFFEVLRRWGKRDVAGIFATQGATDLKEAGRFGKALAQECKTKVLCGDSSAADPDVATDLCSLSSQLTRTKCRAIALNATSRSYMYLSPLGEATFNLGLQTIEKAMTTRDEGDAQRDRRALRASHPRDWFERHLRSQGVGEKWIERFCEIRGRVTPPAPITSTATLEESEAAA